MGTSPGSEEEMIFGAFSKSFMDTVNSNDYFSGFNVKPSTTTQDVEDAEVKEIMNAVGADVEKLVRLLVAKGLLSASDVKRVLASPHSSVQRGE